MAMEVPGIEALTTLEVLSLLEKEAIFLVDVREPKEFEKERIPGAFLFPLSGFDATTIPQDASRRVVFCCGTGKRSFQAARRFAVEGHPSAHLDGGLAAWRSAGLPLVIAAS